MFVGTSVSALMVGSEVGATLTAGKGALVGASTAGVGAIAGEAITGAGEVVGRSSGTGIAVEGTPPAIG